MTCLAKRDWYTPEGSHGTDEKVIVVFYCDGAPLGNKLNVSNRAAQLYGSECMLGYLIEM